MRRMVTAGVAALCVAGALAVSGAACAKAADPLAKLGWMVGGWQGKGLGGDIRSFIEPEHNGEMLVSFTLSRGGKVVRYEFRRMYVKDGKGVIQEQAWGPNMTPVPKVPLRPIVSTDARHADFGSVKYTKLGPNKLALSITIPGRDGKPHTSTFNYIRQFSFNAPQGMAR